MNETKKTLSVLGTLVLMVAAAWLVAFLFSIFWSIPIVICFSLVLALEAAVGWYLIGLRKRRINAKLILGIVFCITLILVLGVGLVTSVAYLVNRFIGGHNGTSFPWYTGFAFAALIGGPIVVLTGVPWIILHLREAKRNVRDIRLLSMLLLFGTAAWAVLWTVDRIRSCLLYPYAYNHPWYFSFLFCLLYFGPGLILEAGIYILMMRREKNLTPEDLAVPLQNTFDTLGELRQMKWNPVVHLGDIAVVAVPLLGAVGLMMILSDTGHFAYNAMTVVGNAAAVVLVLGVAAWLIYHHFGDTKRLRHLRRMTWMLLVLTAAAMTCWIVWYAGKELRVLTGLPQYIEFSFGLGFFGPFLLGEAIVIALLWRIEKRLTAQDTPEKSCKPSLTWFSFLAVVLALSAGMLWLQLRDVDYKETVNAYVEEVTYPDSGKEGHIELRLRSEVFVDGIWEHEVVVAGDTVYMTFSTIWAPFQELEDFHWYHNLYLDPEVTKICIYDPNEGFQTVLTQNPETGLWEFYE